MRLLSINDTKRDEIERSNNDEERVKKLHDEESRLVKALNDARDHYVMQSSELDRQIKQKEKEVIEKIAIFDTLFKQIKERLDRITSLINN